MNTMMYMIVNIYIIGTLPIDYIIANTDINAKYAIVHEWYHVYKKNPIEKV